MALTEYGSTAPEIIIHELGHAIKSYVNEYRIEGNFLYSRSGLIETKELLTYDHETKTVTKKLISEKSVGIEEGLNSDLEEQITKKLYDPDYKVVGYGIVKTLAKNFQDKEMTPLIKEAELTGEREKFITYLEGRFGEGFYEKIDIILDKAYALGLKELSLLFQEEKRKIVSEEIKKLIIEEYNPLLDKMEEIDKEKKNARNSGSRDS